MRIGHEIMRRVRLRRLRIRYFEVEFSKRWCHPQPESADDDDDWEDELYEVIPEDKDPQAMVDERNRWDGYFEWRVAWDMRGNRDYETDARGNFLYRDEFSHVGGGNPRLWRQQRRRVRRALRARRAATILRKLGIDVVARIDVLKFRRDVSIPTYEHHICVTKPAYGELRYVSELPMEYFTDD